MIDLVVPYKPNNSGELNTCIDLIEKNVPHRNIYVVEQYDQQSFSEVPHVNVILKLKWAIENHDLTDDFYLWNDDFFVMKPITDVPYSHKGFLKEQYASTHWVPYKRAIANTIDYFDGENVLSYELHIPFLFNKIKLYALIGELEQVMSRGKSPLIRSTYGNTYVVGGKQMPDVKNPRGNYEDYSFLSTDERTFRGELGEYIKDSLKKEKYEK